MKFGFLSHLDLNLYLFRLPIMKELVKMGHEVYAISPKGSYSSKFKESNITHIPYEIDRKSLNPFKQMSAVENIYQAIKDINLDLFHTFTAKPNIYGTFAAKKANIPTIINLVEGLGSFYVKDSLKNILIRSMMERLYKKAFLQSNRVVFVNSDDPNYMLEKKIIKKDKIKVIKSVGIDSDEYSLKNATKVNDLKKSFGLDNKVVVLMVARALWDKGIREFYEVASLFRDDKDTAFVLIGDVDEANPSSVSKSFLKNPDVLWLGHQDDMLNITAMSDIYVLPSYREGVPRTLLEAASMSKPIVTTNSVGCREVVEDGINGFLVPIKDTKILYEKIKLLVDDEKLRQIMGEEGRKKVLKEFELKHVIKQYIELYREYIDV